jgi:hypothetical protein
LVLCAREPIARDPQEMKAAAGAVDDWDRLIWLASHHGVTAHARRALLAIEGGMSPDVQERLKRDEIADVAGVLLLDVALARALAALWQREVRAIVLKGPVLARRCTTRPPSGLTTTWTWSCVPSSSILRRGRSWSSASLRSHTRPKSPARRSSHPVRKALP